MGDEEQLALSAGKKHGITEALLIYTSKIDVKDFVVLKCTYGCEHYGKNWACPPNSLSAEQTKRLLNEYKKAVLVGTELGEENTKKRFMQGLREIEKKFMQKDYYKALALMPGCCEMCEQCAYITNESCRNPSLRRPALEAMGIDMIATLRKFKKNMKPTKNGEAKQMYGLVLIE